MQAPTVLHLNLSDQSFEVRTHEDLAPLVGGLGWAMALFEEELTTKAEPANSSTRRVKKSEPDGFSLAGSELAEPIVFAVGPLSAVFPGCSKTIAIFRSPQSGFLATSLGGGHLARFLRFAGYQALLVRGKAAKPILVSLEKEQVSFKEGAHLMNKEVPEAFEILFNTEGVPGRRSMLATGLVAERGVTFSPLYIDEFFSFPRGGLGTAFAQKNLKALVVSGAEGEELKDPARYGEIFYSILEKTQGFEELARWGTLKNLLIERKISGIPFENLSESNFEDQNHLLESFTNASRRLSCGGCPVGCIHLASCAGAFFPYDYEGAISLGPLLGLTSAEESSSLLAKAYRIGLDPTSLGAVLAYLIEKEKLSFGNLDTYLALIDALLAGKENWAKALGKGLESGVGELGGEDFALSLAGMEFLPYFNGYATVLSQALSLSATTEENRGYLLDLDLLKGEPEPEAAVAALLLEEKRKTLSEMLIGCGLLSPLFEEESIAFSALEALGIGISHEELEKVVEEVFRRKLSLQKELGFNPEDVKIPAKLFSVPSPQGMLEEGKLREMIKAYVKTTNASFSLRSNGQ